ncbi:MAG: class I SAM-dependent methyltransferase [Candidatus Marsarchaeota archaeon]|nr:class I SAM-dependent methyltransferase [Candidatus Marsarchaeota archaeon]
MSKKLDISKMKVAEIVALVNEVNKPPGGMMTLNHVITNAHINSETKFLEVGCTTGYSSIEIKRLTSADVYGIDVNKDAIERARKKSRKEKLNIKFSVADATALPFSNEFFDVVYASNVTSFIKDKSAAIENYTRILKTYGFLVVAPIYYIKHPPNTVRKAVSEEIGTEIKEFDKKFWVELFNHINLELIYSRDFNFKYNTKDEIIRYINTYIMTKTEVKYMPKNTKNELFNKYKYQFSLFNENLRYTGFSILIYRKVPDKYEKELFPYIP